jgi:adenosine deaminase
VDRELARRAPKVLLHDHLDGGLRPSTILELAGEAGITLPADDEEGLRAWFFQGGRGADLPRYLEAFDQTVALLQTTDQLERVARECAEDLSADGVVHAEVRYAPELSLAGGLTYDEVIEAILDGFAAGPKTTEVRLIVCALRHLDNAEEAFAAAARYVGDGVVAVDLAGPEEGFPAATHRAALANAIDAGLGVTLHAGEAAGPESIHDALDHGAERLGHGVRIVEDIAEDGTLGPVAQHVLDAGIALEVCPSSNVHTGVCADIASHPIDRLRRAGFAVTLNTDNRLMSDVTLTDEVVAVADAFGDDLDELYALTCTAAETAFLEEDERERLLDLLDRGYEALRP